MNWSDVAPQPLLDQTVADAGQFSAFASDAVMIPLSDHALIRFSGEESQSFLNGQLSSDVRALEDLSAQLSSYSTPKGRMLASFVVLRDGDDYLLQLAADIAPAIQKRLSMFVLRSKTRATDAGLMAVGVCGPAAAQRLVAAGLPVPETDFSAARHNGALVLRLAADRFQLLGTPAQVATLWQQLSATGLCAAPLGLWHLAEVRAGQPWVCAATQEEFVPQMANLELIGGISFKKGCYPGQEIVARLQYLGTTKRRALRFHCAEATAPGSDVHAQGGEVAGKVMNAAPAPEGGYELLAVVQLNAAEQGLVLGGNALRALPLPYPLEHADA
ncbi:CAF17-like 4Fe-4S cluster assembly/insertion protein YgfZ [Chitinibacteraceae bacterium HSL-7]